MSATFIERAYRRWSKTMSKELVCPHCLQQITSELETYICPYKFVKIDGYIYKRLSRHTCDSIIEKLEDGADKVAYIEITCPDCGVLHNNIHHTGCKAEVCPKCYLQFATCGCGGDHRRYYKQKPKNQKVVNVEKYT